jgi:hypothetical protein
MSLTETLGWCAALAAAAALMNFLLKQVSREYVKNISAANPAFASSYRTFMQFMIRNHRFFGMAAGALFAVHVGVVLSSGVSSLTGIVAGILLLTVSGLGAYGFYIRKNPRGKWIHAHRGVAFLLTMAAIAHIFFKAAIYLPA